MNPESQQKARTLIKSGEGSISHMYLDTVGKVTIGVGNMLPTAESAAEHPFVHADDGTPATAEEIRAEFEHMSEQTEGKLAANYKQYTKLVLTEDYIDELLNRRIDGFEQQLKRDFPKFEAYPEPAMLGLMDMAFNLGNAGLVNKFPTFTKAAQDEDWSACERECNRRGISETRNDEVKSLFRDSIG